jgi:hypothetical protein
LWFFLRFGWILLKNVNFECWQSNCSRRITECSASYVQVFSTLLIRYLRLTQIKDLTSWAEQSHNRVFIWVFSKYVPYELISHILHSLRSTSIFEPLCLILKSYNKSSIPSDDVLIFRKIDVVFHFQKILRSFSNLKKIRSSSNFKKIQIDFNSQKKLMLSPILNKIEVLFHILSFWVETMLHKKNQPQR